MITDLTEEIAARTAQPPFETVVARVREDRQRTVRRVAIGGAVLAASALLVVPRLGTDSADEQPTNPGPSIPTPSEGLALGVADLLARPTVRIAGVGGADDGGVAVLWQGCTGDGTDCDYAVLTRNGSSHLGSVPVDSGVLSPTPDGWLIHTEGGWRLLTSDGGVTGVTTAGLDGVRAGDVVVQTPGGLELLRGDRLLLMPKRDGNLTSGFVTPGGRLLQTTYSPTGQGHLVATRDGEHWTTVRTWAPAANLRISLAGHGRTLAAVVQSIGISGHTAVQQVDLSHDGGRTWATARGIDFGNEVRDVSGVAVSNQGTVYLTTGSDGLIRIDAEGNAQRTSLGARDESVFTTTYDVCALVQPKQASRQQTIACSEDDGTTWTDRSPPGSSLVTARTRRP